MAPRKPHKSIKGVPGAARGRRNLRRRVGQPNNTDSSTSNRDGSHEVTFFSLPGEIGNRIYQYAFQTKRPNRTKQRKDRAPEPPLLRTSKQIRNEATSLYYSAHIFRADVSNLDFSTVVNRLRDVIVEHGVTKPILVIHMHKLKSEHVERVFDLVKLMVETDLVLKPRFVPYHYGYKQFKRTMLPELDEAVALGKNAYAQGWSEQMLEYKFVQWIDGEISVAELSC